MKSIGAQLFSMLPDGDQRLIKETLQSPKWHPEGSVYNHISLVSDLLPDTPLYQALAVFHDLGKISTTKAIEKDSEIKIQSIGHEFNSLYGISAFEKSYRFDSFNLPWEEIKEVVRDHMRMHQYRAGTMRDTKKTLLELSPYFDTKLVFVDADDAGVGSPDQAMPLVVITVGIPGSGKSTWAKVFCSSSGYTRICPDDIREELTGSVSDQSKNALVWKTAYNRLAQAIEQKQNVIFDSTACNVNTIKQLEETCNGRAIPIFKIFNVDASEARKRIAEDLRKGINRSAVPDGIVERMNSAFQQDVLNYVGAVTKLKVV